MITPLNNDWKANSQANAAALNIIYEYVGTTFGGIPAIEHMTHCGTDPAIVAQHIIETLERHVQQHITD